MLITLAQINFNPEQVGGHLERIKDIISQHQRSDLIVFPELILHGHPSQLKPEGFLYRQVRAALHSASQELYKHVARCNTRVILGELKRRGDNYLNLATYVDGDGPQSYAKTHTHWTENFVPGQRLQVFDTPLGKIGINICYDAAFVEVWRVLALMGAEVIVNISAAPIEFAARHMLRRMRAAAAVNQLFVVYVNRPGPVFSGHSAVFGPQGDQLLDLGLDEQVASVEIDLGQAQRWRQEEVIFAHRRPLLYRRVANRAKYIPRTRRQRRLRIAG